VLHNGRSFIILLCASLGLWSGMAVAVEGVIPGAISSALKGELAKKYPGNRIELISEFSVTRGELPTTISHVMYVGESTRGEAQFAVSGRIGEEEKVAEGSIRFAAFVPAWIAIHRIHPGQALTNDLFTTQDVNVASGMAAEYRGVILPKTSDITGLEAKQSILEGQYVLSTSVQRIPDIRRGDAVRVKLISGEITLNTSGTAAEPAYINDQVHVTASKGKRDLTGKLRAGGIVEVRL
jgi:flagella basal body P-ring formation protein FlgA